MSQITRILLLEDDIGDAKLFKMRLVQAQGDLFEVTHADRLSTALQLLSKGPFDLIVTDLSLPDSRGLATFTELQARAEGAPIIIVSELDDAKSEVEALQKGAQDFVRKEKFTGDHVVQAIQMVVERQRKTKVQTADTRAPEELIDLIETKGLEIARALASLRASLKLSPGVPEDQGIEA